MAGRVFITGAGSAYHETPFCSLLKAGQEKALERGHIVTKIRCVPIGEAEERRRRPCPGCVRTPRCIGDTESGGLDAAEAQPHQELEEPSHVRTHRHATGSHHEESEAVELQSTG